MPVALFQIKMFLSAFKEHSERSMIIQKGMTPKEISDVVSDKIIAVVKEQFQATKEQFQAREKK